MKKPSAKIREEIARLQDQLRVAEGREAERIGRLALRAGLGDVEVEDGDLVAAFEELARRFLDAAPKRTPVSKVSGGTPQGASGEA